MSTFIRRRCCCCAHLFFLTSLLLLLFALLCVRLGDVTSAQAERDFGGIDISNIYTRESEAKVFFPSHDVEFWYIFLIFKFLEKKFSKC